METKFTLSSNDYCFSYNERCILNNISFSLQSGEIMAVMGLNGAGKSTLLRSLAGLFPRKTSFGLYTYDKPLAEYSIAEYAKLVSYVAQSVSVTNPITVREYVVMGRQPYMCFLSRPSQDDYDIVDNTIEFVGLQAYANTPISLLSGGELKKAQIARALVKQSKIILFDEPFSCLDLCAQHMLLTHMKHLADNGCTVVFSTHDPNHAFFLQSKVLLLNKTTSTFGDCCSLDVLTEIHSLFDGAIRIVPNGDMGCMTSLTPLQCNNDYKPCVYLFIGHVASGKTTCARKIAKEKGAVLLSLDEVTCKLSSAITINRDNRQAVEAQILAYLYNLALSILALGTSVVIDHALLKKADRKNARDFFSDYNTIITYMNTSRSIRLQRLEKRNNDIINGLDGGFSKVISLDNYKYIESYYETPSADEYDIVVECDTSIIEE